jgi:hypothetical protein
MGKTNLIRLSLRESSPEGGERGVPLGLQGNLRLFKLPKTSKSLNAHVGTGVLDGPSLIG